MDTTTSMIDWLNRLHTIDSTSDIGAKGAECNHKNLEPYDSGGAKSDKSVEPTELIIVAYQRFSLDYDLPDGTYTPQELRQAKLLVKRGPVLRYRLHWPGGRPQPIAGRESMTADHRKRA